MQTGLQPDPLSLPTAPDFILPVDNFVERVRLSDADKFLVWNMDE